jgi:hypothetical protein
MILYSYNLFFFLGYLYSINDKFHTSFPVYSSDIFNFICPSIGPLDQSYNENSRLLTLLIKQ